VAMPNARTHTHTHTHLTPLSLTFPFSQPPHPSIHSPKTHKMILSNFYLMKMGVTPKRPMIRLWPIHFCLLWIVTLTENNGLPK